MKSVWKYAMTQMNGVEEINRHFISTEIEERGDGRSIENKI